MSLPKFPRNALQVLRAIRAEVPRPDTLPGYTRLNTYWLRWTATGCGGHICPMGLLPFSALGEPTQADDLQCRFLDSSVRAFYEWWDSLTIIQAQEAVEFIWPEVAL